MRPVSRSGSYPRSLLIVQTGFLGDAVLATSAIRHVQDCSPDTRIGFLVRDGFDGLFHDHPGVSRLHLVDKGDRQSRQRVLYELKEYGYDAAISPHRSARSAILLVRAGIGKRIGYDCGGGASLYSERVRYRIGVREVERVVDLLAPLGFTPSEHPVRAWLAGNEHLSFSRLPVKLRDNPYIVIAPGSVWPTKQWPRDRYAELIRLLNERGNTTVLVGSTNERVDSLAIAHAAGLHKDLVLTGELTLTELRTIIARSICLVGNDSAPVHIADALDIPSVSMFGPTIPEFGFVPVHRNSVAVQSNGLPCRPCGLHGGHVCPLTTHACMKGIEVNQVLEGVEAILESLTDDRLS